jgi:hypothetical protein
MPAPQQQPTQDVGDAVCWGMDDREARLVPPGFASALENVRCTDGVPTTRPGVTKPTWANLVEVGDAVGLGYGKPYGAGAFRDPNGVEWMLIAAGGSIWRTRPFNGAALVRTPVMSNGQPIPIVSKVIFTQAFGKVFLFRGRRLKPLRMVDLNRGFEDLVPMWKDGTQYAAGTEVAFGPWFNVASVTADGTTVTVATTQEHGLVTGQDVVLRGADTADYNGRFAAVVQDAKTFTYELAAAPADDAGGSPSWSPMVNYWAAGTDTNTPAAGESPESTPAKWQQVFDILPNGEAALFVNNRLLVATAYSPETSDYKTFTQGSYTKCDFVVATDIQDEVHFLFSNESRINQGSADEIVDLAKFSEDSVIVFKGASWGVMSNLGPSTDGTLEWAPTLDMRSMEIGLSARGAWAVAGAELYFLAGKRGVMGVRSSEMGKLVSVEVPLSLTVQSLINQIRWTAADGIRMACWQSKLYVAVPLGGGQAGNNAMLVYDFVAAAKAQADQMNPRGWAGLDTGNAINPLEFLKLTVEGVERLLYLGADGYVNLMEQSDCGDQVDGGWEEIEVRKLSRAFTVSMNGLLRPTEAAVAMQTWNPKLTVRVWLPGHKVITLVTQETRSRLAYARPWDATPWNPLNVNDDHETDDREDYSVVLQDGLSLGSGLVLDRMQEGIETWTVTGRQGRSFQVETINEQGRIELLGERLNVGQGRKRHGVQT